MKLFRYISIIALAAATAVNAYADKTNFRWIKDIDYAKVRHFSQGHSAFQENGKWGFINTASKICIRMLSRKKEQVITPAFLEERVRAAWDYRKKVIDTSSCRVIFGEADFLPGLVIDKFSDVLVVESLALGIDKMKLTIVELLKKVLLNVFLVLCKSIELGNVYSELIIQLRKFLCGDCLNGNLEHCRLTCKLFCMILGRERNVYFYFFTDVLAD